MASIFDTLNPTNAVAPTNGIIGLMKNPQIMQSIKSMSRNMQMLQGMGQGGIQQLLPMLAQNNPQMGQIVQMLQSGGNPRQMVEQKLQELGIDQNEFMFQLQTML